ncbi:type VI secretion system baseplate subunit TssG [Cobetia marina]|uniref:type VI secretion system baseplate subunit TssG n=1 Tax=Cobetia marina TaxID=28258 RepID=UPI0008667A7A|nr:type VI secretion system baseplate subunit TssG [Cobetia marina]AOM01652.1 type VI secretion system protein [Cobetia marina]
MARQNRHSAPGLIDQARAEPYRFSFFQLVRLLRLHYSRAGRLEPELRPHEDPLRFRSQLSLNFPASEVSDLVFESETSRSPTDQPLTQVQVTFMGLVGPSGVLPRPYTETLIDRHVQLRDDGAHAFFDLFSHRMTALFYQAWQKYRFHIEYERRGETDFERQLLALSGVSGRSAQLLFAGDDALVDENRDNAAPSRGLGNQDGRELPRELFSFFAGLLGQRPRNQQNLTTLLGSFFGVPCEVKPFQGRWLDISEPELTRLGQANARLGQSAVAGKRAWDYQSCVRIAVGPLRLADFRRFLPGGEDHLRMTELIRFYVGPELDFELELQLEPSEVPPARLGGAGGISLGRLGWLGQTPRSTSGSVLLRIPFDGVTP